MKIHLFTNFLSLLLILFFAGVNTGSAGETNHSSSSNRAEFYYQQGTNHFVGEEWNQAIDDFTKYIQFNPTNALAYGLRGCSYIVKGDLDKGIKDLSRQIQLDPTNEIAYCNRGSAHQAKLEFDLALLDYNQCLQFNPTNFHALGGRATVYKHRREYQKEAHDLDRALLLNSAYDVIWMMRGCARSHLHQYAGAVADFHQAIQINPTNSEAYNELGWLLAVCPLATSRNGKEAVEMATKACELADWKQWDYLDTLAAAFAETGDFEKAAKYAKQALKLSEMGDKDRPDIKKRLALFEQRKAYRESE